LCVVEPLRLDLERNGGTAVVNELDALLQQLGYPNHKIAGLLLSGADGVAVLPFKMLAALELARPPAAPDVGRKSRDFKAWCKYRGIGRSTGYRLLKAGRGPELIKINNKMLVTPEADEKWVRERELERARAA
jgi:hypothetical protein